MNRSRWRVVARWGGVLLTGASLVFVGKRLGAAWDEIAVRGLGGAMVGTVAAASLAYALLSLCLSFGWWRLTRPPGGFRAAHTAYARSQIAKYLPGNVFHLAGRHAYGRTQGSSHGRLASAAGVEISGLVTAAATVGAVGAVGAIGAATLPVPGSGRFGAWVLTGIAAAGLAATVLVARWSGQAATAVAAALAAYGAFFVGNGAILLELGRAVGPETGIGAAALSVFAVSWIAGFLTPGAPAGLGVREAVVVLTLGAVVPETQALVTALLLRFVTVAGDLVYFATSLLPGGPTGDTG